mmetsp:Transcript_13607/g.33435  ORF Transcript_13607/g.33435 Transcript_13607/m.33435 type:complete len:874 (-) Transcript_13607:923-3544(-)
MAKLLDFGFENIDLWRSEEMQLVQLMIPAESAHDTVAALGDIGLLQFKDLNTEKSAFQRTYANQVKRCDEMARKLRFFTEQVEKAGLKIAQHPTWERTISVDELEAKLEDMEREVLEVNSNNERLQRSHAELEELQVLLERAGQFFDAARAQAARDALPASSAVVPAPSQDFSSPLLGDARDREGGGAAFVDHAKAGRLGFVAGLVSAERLSGFERLLFRATRGNMFLRTTPVGRVQDPASGERMEKVVFVVFFAGERARTKIMKICEAFGANRYPFPEEVARQHQMHAEVTARLRELSTTIDAGDLHRTTVLQGAATNLDQWTTLVRREKAVYHTLNKFSLDTSRKVLVAEAWVPAEARARVAETLRAAAEASHNTGVSAVLQPMHAGGEAPPTYFATNKFTACFQNIVSAYGVARYREVNPTVFTIMTFPFLFAVMFGDFGHGFLMLLFAAVLLWNEKKMSKMQLDDMTVMAFGGRYCILLMAIFSIFTGALYNEFFSIPMAIFGDTRFKCWGVADKVWNGTAAVTVGQIDGFASNKDFDIRNCKTWGGRVLWPGDAVPYVFGIDPIWHGRKTELPFLNSFKMKMSIVMGVLHMDFGIINCLYNNMFFRDTVSTLFEFIPQMIFLNFIFGYLSILIVAKWCTGSTADLYHVMINMFLSPGSMDDQGRVFNGQGGLQVFLLLIAFIMVPTMLLPKPLILKKRHEQMQRERGAVEMAHGTFSHDDEEGHAPAPAPAHGAGGHDGGHGHGDHFDFGEIMVHQMIHTIEFILGAVSNTASYLRLWALSLAHSQLSSVFFDRVLMMAMSMNSIGAIFIGFFVFACATLGVLMVMESLSAFLHAMRLHWVEFQNKFYRGDGYQFTPFTFDAHDKEEH